MPTFLDIYVVTTTKETQNCAKIAAQYMIGSVWSPQNGNMIIRLELSTAQTTTKHHTDKNIVRQ